MRRCWLDIRRAGEHRAAVCAEALHHRLDAIVAGTAEDLAGLPPTIRRVLLLADGGLPDDLGNADVVIVDPDRHGAPGDLTARYPGVEFGRFIEVMDGATLAEATASARTERYTVIRFRDPTKIPLEIVLAAAAGAEGAVITVADDVADAKIVFGVLEYGSAVMLAARVPGEAAALAAAATEPSAELALTELRVVGTRAVGMGERVCVDTCSYLRQDEGILVGSHSKGFILCVSETHPLPYMPTRPFRVNAGAVMSYALDAGGRTRYLTELQAGSTVLAVDAKGGTRVVTVGRAKIETRPLLAIDAVADDGRPVNLIVQNDWHVRVLGPGAAVLNSTELTAGDRVLGYLATEDRHVGYPIDERCVEQ